jgi:hypothetical protein
MKTACVEGEGGGFLSQESRVDEVSIPVSTMSGFGLVIALLVSSFKMVETKW